MNFYTVQSHHKLANMSVPYKIEAMEELLVNTGRAQVVPASEKIPIMARGLVSDRAKKTLDIV